MKIQVKIFGKVKWEISSIKDITVYFRGSFFHKNQFYDAINAVNYLKNFELNNLEIVKEQIKDFSGFFSIIISNNQDNILLISDKVASIPLFYNISESEIVVTDNLNPNYFLNIEIDDTKAIEYLNCLYVLNNDTFIKGFNKTKAGTITRLSINSIKQFNYFVYYSNIRTDKTENKLIEDFDHILSKVFDRCIRFLDGRTAVVPLSGGLDSRLVVSMLKKKNYENLICYAYGSKNSLEVQKSQQIADKLGYKWFFIEYNKSNLKSIFKSEEITNYWKYAGNASSIPHPDEFLALYEINKFNKVPVDTVFLPGHTGDFISGGHLGNVYDQNLNLKNDLTTSIIKKHCSLNTSLLTTATLDNLKESVNRTLNELNKVDNLEDSQYEYWEWRERQSKYIINAVRSYEFFHYGWYIPLWDDEIMNYWKEIPLTLKYNKNLYKKFLFKTDKFHVFQDINSNKVHTKRFKKPQRQLLKELLDKIHVAPSIIDWIFNIDRLNIEYKTHGINFAQTFGYFEYIFSKTNKRNVQYLFAEEYLARIWKVNLVDLIKKNG